ncbi:MAG TPA: prepilin-type N-terminal cleavage/methylation domain-containing protein [Actinophytocola sp.]|jgi:general secretion pathway protein G|uniref:type IV pilin protein n=1 Tax=Actinophytocola sp. TaxID=1872138 RepID=UPI002E0947DA|nr:prepilin-type N-terminal cleavage/methylation domain-containing protein [Actinophytocola sp.]
MLERMREARRNESGFTLIELLIVIVILGVLAGIVVFAVNGIQNKGEVNACQSNVKTVTVAAEAYYAQKGSYASAIDDVGHTATTLVGAGLLHSAPTDVDYSVSGGAVSVKGLGKCPGYTG